MGLKRTGSQNRCWSWCQIVSNAGCLIDEKDKHTHKVEEKNLDYITFNTQGIGYLRKPLLTEYQEVQCERADGKESGKANSNKVPLNIKIMYIKKDI